MKYSFKADRASMAVVFSSLLKNKHLNDWEKHFIDSLNNKFVAAMKLTDKQLKTLSGIWEKY